MLLRLQYVLLKETQTRISGNSPHAEFLLYISVNICRIVFVF